MSSQITSLTIAYSTVYLDADKKEHQSSASLACVREIHREPVNSPHKGPVTQKMFPFDDVIMSVYWLWRMSCICTLLAFYSHFKGFIWCIYGFVGFHAVYLYRCISLPLLTYMHFSDVIMGTMASKKQRLDCLLNCLFRHRSKKTLKLCVTGICDGNSIPHTKGQQRGKSLHLMTSSCIQ